MRGMARRIEAARNAAVIGGWIAALQGRATKMDDLSDVLGWFEPKPPPRPQTADEMVTALRTLVIATGGALAADSAADPEQETAS